MTGRKSGVTSIGDIRHTSSTVPHSQSGDLSSVDGSTAFDSVSRDKGDTRKPSSTRPQSGDVSSYDDSTAFDSVSRDKNHFEDTRSQSTDDTSKFLRDSESSLFSKALSTSTPGFKRESSRKCFTGGDSSFSVTAPLAPSMRKSNDISELTINKLRFSDLGVYGRQKEVDNLSKVYDDCIDPEASASLDRQLVLIGGASGTGKSRLANVLRSRTDGIKSLFVRGKFDNAQSSQRPFAGIVDACAELCGALVQLRRDDEKKSANLILTIERELGSELSLLLDFIPELSEVLDVSSSMRLTRVASIMHEDGAKSKNQFNFAFKRLMRVVCRCFQPFILFIDDLQWADAPSLEILEALMADEANSNLIVIGAYRSNEVDETHVLYRIIEDLDKSSSSGIFTMLSMKLGNLNPDAVHEVVQCLLDEDADTKTRELAEICYDKTQGNAFFLLRFMQMLVEAQLVTFSLGTLTWHWDRRNIEAKTTSTDNVLDIITERMEKLDKDLTLMLRIAAHLGSSFDEESLRLVWDHFDERIHTDDEKSDFEQALNSLIKKGFILRIPGVANGYCWEHDKIQEAALATVSEENEKNFTRKMGEILAAELSEVELVRSARIFVVVDLLNRSLYEQEDGQKRLHLALLNLRACQQAMSFSAFTTATDYASNGILLLPEDPWRRKHQILTLSLYCLGAKAHQCTGNSEEMKRLCKIVLDRKDIKVEDKFSAYLTWVNSCMTGDCPFEEGVDLILGLLESLSVKFPKNKVITLVEIGRQLFITRKRAKSLDVSTMPKLTDRRAEMAMLLLDKLVTCFYATLDPRLPLCMLKSFDLTLKHGYADISPSVLAWAACFITGALKDRKGAEKCADDAIALLDRTTVRDESRTLFVSHCFTYQWVRPLNASTKPLLQAYDQGIRSGDTENAMLAIADWTFVKYRMGTSLELLEKDSGLYARQARDVKQLNPLSFLLLQQQCCLNLMGIDNIDDPSRLVGSLITDDDIKTFNGVNQCFPGVIGLRKAVLFAFLGRHIENADDVLEQGQGFYDKNLFGWPGVSWCQFLTAVSCYAAYHKKRENKYLKVAKLLTKKANADMNGGNPNVVHYAMFLTAEELALKKRQFPEAVKKFEATIFLAARNGCIHDAAFACERLAELHLRVKNDTAEAKYQITQAMKYYGDWGAQAKIRMLEKKYDDIFPRPSTVLIG